MEPEVVNRNLPVKLTAEELSTYRQVLPALLVQIDSREADIKAYVAEGKATLKLLQTEANAKRDACVSGQETRTVACQWRVNGDRRELVRLDTQEVVEVVGLTAQQVMEQRQRRLRFDSVDPIQDEAIRAQILHFCRSFEGKKVDLSQVVGAFPEYREEALRSTLGALVEEGHLEALLDGWRAKAESSPAKKSKKNKGDDGAEGEPH